MADDNNQENIRGKKEQLTKEIQKFEKSPWVFLIRKNKLTYLIIAFLLIFGLLTIGQLPRELNPEVEIPVGIVATVFPGASPRDVEEQVTREIEDQISNLAGIDEISSTSSLGVSVVVVEFEADQNVDDSIRKLKDEVDKTIFDLPGDAETPEVIEVSFESDPIFVATLTGERYDVSDLKRFAENIEDQLKGIPFVSDVRVVGGRERVVQVDIDQYKLSRHGLTLQQVAGALAAQHFDLPAGAVEINDFNYSVRVLGKFTTAQEVAKLPLKVNGGVPVLLEDVAEVRDGFAKETSRSRFSAANAEPLEAVSIQLFKKAGGNVTEVTRQARERIEAGKGRDYPDDVRIEITRDFSEFIVDSINDLSANGMFTVAIIFTLLFVFLGWREALIAGLAVPFSFFISFITMAIVGESLNFLSLFSLVLALGLLVDSAIVVVEGMFSRVASLGVSGYQAAVLTIRDYAAPLLSGMLTTVAAFLPLLFVMGIFGQFMKTIPVVVITTISAALFVALTIVPAIGAFAIRPESVRPNGNHGKVAGWFRKMCRYIKILCRSKPRHKRRAHLFFEKLANRYGTVLPKIISEKKTRTRLIVGVWVLLAVSLVLPFSGLLKIQSFVAPDSEFFFINVKLPNGATLNRTEEVIREVEDILRADPQVANFVTSIGASIDFTSFASSAQGGQTNRAFLEVNLTKTEERKETSTKIISRVRQALNREITEAEVTIVEEEGGPPAGAAVEARVTGEDLQLLEQVANQVRDELENIPTAIDVVTSVELSSGELVFVPNKDVLESNGLTVAQVAAELREGIARDQRLEISREGKEIKIDVGYPEAQLGTVDGIRDIGIHTPQGNTLAVSELGELTIEPALATINRIDKKRVVSVTADTEGGNPAQISQELKDRVTRMTVPPGVNVSFGGELQELQEVYQDMFIKMIIGIILILFILVVQFNSYRQTFIILFTIPLAMIGVLWGMTLARLALDIPSFVGIVSLSGIVVNNAIILIDRINKEVQSGKELVLAVQSAGCDRLRPIILTTITTVFGLLPLSITQPLWRNLGFSIIFGLTFSALLTLFVVPTLYVSLHKKIRTRNDTSAAA